MKPFSLFEIARMSGIQLVSDDQDVQIRDVVDDSDGCSANTVFFHTKRKDMHWNEYADYPSCYLITDDAVKYESAEQKSRVILVNDVREAYWRFVSSYRNMFDLPVIGVTGTCGKTTTKEMIKHILLSSGYRVQATVGSKNSDYFNLSYLLGLDDDIQMAVFEMGVAEPGDILYSARYFHPNVGVITNIGIDHLDECGTLDNYIQAKAEMVEALDYAGSLVLNADDENIKKIDLSAYQGNIVYFGQADHAHVRATNIDFADTGIEFTVHLPDFCRRMFIPGHGEHTVYNGLAAIAAIHALGIDVDSACKSLASFQQVRSHLQVFQGTNSATIVDDTWSSNPTSTEAAVRALNQIANGRKTVLVMGRMAPLGDAYWDQTKRIGELIARQSIDYLVTKGTFARDIGKEAVAAGMPKDRVYMCADADEVEDVVRKLIDSNTVALFKVWAHDESFEPIIERLKL